MAPGMAHRSQPPRLWRHLDVAMILVVVLIGAFGCLMVYTATRDRQEAAGLSPLYYVEKQAIFMLIGVVAMGLVAAVDYRRYREWAVPIYGFSVFLLLAVFAVGHKSKGAQAWFQIGSYQLEPSEFVKVGLIIALASYCAAAKGKL